MYNFSSPKQPTGKSAYLRFICAIILNCSFIASSVCFPEQNNINVERSAERPLSGLCEEAWWNTEAAVKLRAVSNESPGGSPSSMGRGSSSMKNRHHIQYVVSLFSRRV